MLIRLALRITAAVFLCVGSFVFATASQTCPLQVVCTLRVANMIAPANINPSEALGIWNLDLIENLFEGLVALDSRGNPIPGQAERWDVSEDGLVYTFHLRDGIQWSDGQPVLAEHFVRPWVMGFTTDNAGSIAYMLNAVENGAEVRAGTMPPEALGIRALDDKTIEIRLKQPLSLLPAVLAVGFLKPIPLHALPEYTLRDVWVSADELVFNGAFVLEGTLADDPIILKRNPTYHRSTQVYFDVIKIRTRMAEREAVARILAGELDVIQMSTRDQIEAIQSINPDLISEGGSASAVFYVFNLEKGNVANPLVRKALAMLATSETIAVASNASVPIEAFVVPTLQGYPNNLSQPKWRRWSIEDRLAEARNLMRRAGYGPDNLMKLNLRILNSETSIDAGRLLKSLWSQVYVDVNAISSKPSDHFGTSVIRGGHYDVAEITWTADVNDAHNFLALLRSNGHSNHAHWNNRDYDALLREYEATGDLKTRQDLVRRMLEIVDAELPLFPAYQRDRLNLLRPNVIGYNSNPVSIHPFRYIRRDLSN